MQILFYEDRLNKAPFSKQPVDIKIQGYYTVVHSTNICLYDGQQFGVRVRMERNLSSLSPEQSPPSEEDGLTLSVLKALDILDCLHAAQSPLSPAEIGTALGITRPTVYRLLTTMATRGWVNKDPQNSSKYRIGYRVLQLAGAYLKDMDARAIARPVMEELAREYDETVTLFVLDQTEVVFIDRVSGSSPLQSFLSLGSRGCLHSKAVGKAILAAMSDAEVERIVAITGLEPRTPSTITDLYHLKKELARVRERGYATADNEDVVGLRAVGAAIRNFQGVPIGGLAISGLTARMSDERVVLLGEALREATARISEHLGYDPAEGPSPRGKASR